MIFYFEPQFNQKGQEDINISAVLKDRLESFFTVS